MQTTIDTVQLAFLTRSPAQRPDVKVPAPVPYIRVRPGVCLAPPRVEPASTAPPPAGGPPVAGPPAPGLPKRILPFWKRTLDLLLLLALLPAALVVALVVALIIKCGSRGPVLYFQERIGYRGRKFKFCKFRTMHVAVENDSHRAHARRIIHDGGPMTKLDRSQDPRLIPLGGALRAAGLDELPQLINVFFGDMSFVGPRPCLAYEYELYAPAQRRRFDAVPGLTGLWQVSGKNRTTFRRMIDLDLEYLEHCCLGLDLKIIARTAPVLWSQFREFRRSRAVLPEPRPRRNPDSLIAAADQL